MESDTEYIKRLVKERLYAMSPDVSFSVGHFGYYTLDELIEQVDKIT